MLFYILFRVLSAPPIVIGVFVIGFQIYVWLKDGMWLSISVGSALLLAGADGSWTTWKGLVLILEWLPLSASLLCIGIVLQGLAEVYGRDLD